MIPVLGRILKSSRVAVVFWFAFSIATFHGAYGSGVLCRRLREPRRSPDGFANAVCVVCVDSRGFCPCEKTGMLNAAVTAVAKRIMQLRCVFTLTP